MTDFLSVWGLLLFGAAAFFITRLDNREHDRDRILAWLFGCLGVVVVATAAVMSGDFATLGRAAATGVSLAAMPFGARMLFPDGIDLIDTGVTACVGFTVGVASWGLAWTALVAAAGIAGMVAAVDLVRHNDRERRVPFGQILVSVAIAATVVT